MPYATEAGAKVPGWTRLKVGRASKYRAPDGQVVGSWAYSSVLKHWQRTGEALKSPLTQKAGIQGSISTQNYQDNSDDINGLDFSSPQPPEPRIVEIPEAKPTPASKTAKGLFTARQLSEGYATALILVTSIVAVALSLPEAQMRENEVKAISIPLANLTERSRYNRMVGSIIVEKSDYLVLGYALYQYVDRVTTALRERNGNAGPVGNAPQAQGTGPNGATGVNGTGGVPLPYASKGLRGIVGNAQ